MIKVRDARWSTNAEDKLIAWKNVDCWQEGYEKAWIGNFFPRGEVLQNFESFLKITQQNFHSPDRKIIYIPFDSTHLGQALTTVVCKNLGLEVPLIPNGAKPKKLNPATQKPVLAITLDFVNEAQIFKNVTLVIPHWESIGFLRLCIESVHNTFSETEVPDILVVDDASSARTWEQIDVLAAQYTFKTIQILREDKDTVADVGKLLDVAIKEVKTEYICMLDADTVVLDRTFLSKPLDYLQFKTVVSVGLDTNLSDSYHANKNWKKFGIFDNQTLSLPGYISVTNNLYRVMRTLDAKAISMADPFSRRVSDRRFRDQLGRALRRIDLIALRRTKFSGASREVIKSRILNSSWPSLPPTSDNGVNANYWMDGNNLGRKINIPITSFGFLTPNDGSCFQNISGSLVHVALSTRALSKERREIKDPGDTFYNSVAEIVENQFESQEMRRKVESLSKTISINFKSRIFLEEDRES